MRYGENQCGAYGGIRVAKSTLDAKCIARAYSAEQIEIENLKLVIELLKKKRKTLTGLLEDAIWYGFKQNRKIFHLEKQIKESIDIIKRGIEDGKNWETENTEK